MAVLIGRTLAWLSLMSTDARPITVLTDSERRAVLRDGLALISGAQVATALGAIASVVLRAAVAPTLMGIWSTMRTVLEYGTYSSFGINRAAGRDIAVATGRGDTALKRQIADVAMTNEVGTGLIVASALVVAGFVQAARGSAEWAAACAVAALLAVVGRYHGFCLTVLRSTKNFPVLAQARAVGAVADLVLMAGGAVAFGYFGLLAGAAAAQLLNASFVRSIGRLRFAPRLDHGLTQALILGGWPIAAEALALTALRSVDRLVIVGWLSDGAEQLGWYSVAMLLAAWLFDQANLVANVIYPRQAESLGRSGDRVGVVALGLGTAEVIALAMAPCSALLLGPGTLVIDWLLPSYRPGLTAASGLVIGAAALGVAMPLRYSLVTLGRTPAMLLATVLAALSSLAGAYWFATHEGTLVHIALSSAAAATFCLVLMVTLCCAAGGPIRSAVRVCVAVVYAFGGAMALGPAHDANLGVWFAGAAAWCAGPMVLLAQRLVSRPLCAGDHGKDPS